jgi:hypothetical protein
VASGKQFDVTLLIHLQLAVLLENNTRLSAELLYNVPSGLFKIYTTTIRGHKKNFIPHGFVTFATARQWRPPCELYNPHIVSSNSRHYATSRKVAGSRPDEVNGIFSIYLQLPAALGPQAPTETSTSGIVRPEGLTQVKIYLYRVSNTCIYVKISDAGY